MLPEYEDVLTREETDMDFDFEMEIQQVENDPPEQVNLLTTENLEAFLEHVKRSVGNPPFAPSFTDQEPPLDAVADLVPRKRRRRDPQRGIVIRELETEHVSVTQIQTTTVELPEPSPQVKEPVDGSSSHAEDLDYDSFLAGEQVTRADRGKNVVTIQNFQSSFNAKFLEPLDITAISTLFTTPNPHQENIN
ncbi:hypothetical protein R6Q57_008357 [Mikania cordata]